MLAPVEGERVQHRLRDEVPPGRLKVPAGIGRVAHHASADADRCAQRERREVKAAPRPGQRVERCLVSRERAVLGGRLERVTAVFPARERRVHVEKELARAVPAEEAADVRLVVHRRRRMVEEREAGDAGEEGE